MGAGYCQKYLARHREKKMSAHLMQATSSVVNLQGLKMDQDYESGDSANQILFLLCDRYRY